VDSLKKIISEKNPDTSKVQAMIGLATEYYFSFPSIALEYSEQARQLSEKTGYTKGILNAYGWLAYLNEQKGDINKALIYYEKSLKLSNETGNKKDAATILNNIAAIYKDQGFIEKALDYHQRSLDLKIQINDQEGIATSYNNIGLIYFNQGQIEVALQYYHKCLQIEEAANNKDGISTSYQNIGAVYKEQDQPDIAMDYYQKSLALRKEINDKYGIAHSLNSIGGLYEDKNDLQQALKYYQQALQIRKEIEDKQGIAYANKNIGVIYEKLGRNDMSEYYFKLSLETFKETGDKWGQAVALNKYGGILLGTNKLIEAENNLLLSLQLAKELGYPNDIKNAADNLQKLYRNKKQWQKALQFNDLYILMRDSIQNNVNRKITLQRQFQYEYEKKEAVLKAEQDKINAISEARLQKEKIIKNASVAGAVLLLILSFVLFNRYRIKKQAQEKVQNAYDKLKQTQDQLIRQEKLASLGALTAGIAHEIQNPLNFVNNFSDLSVELIEDAIDSSSPAEQKEILNDLRVNLEKISHHGNRAGSIVKSMLEHSHTATGKIQLEKLPALCDEYLNLAYRGMKIRNPEFECDIIKEYDPELKPVMLIARDISRVLINLFGNAFYALKNIPAPKLTIIIKDIGDFTELRIIDNGTGIPKEVQHKIFEPFFTTKPTGEGTGLGLSISYDIMVAHGGEISFESEPGKGTTFILRFKNP